MKSNNLKALVWAILITAVISSMGRNRYLSRKNEENE